MLNQDAIEIIGTLPNLAVLRLHTDSFSEKHPRFRRSSFQSLLLLELHELLVLFGIAYLERAFQISCIKYSKSGGQNKLV